MGQKFELILALFLGENDLKSEQKEVGPGLVFCLPFRKKFALNWGKTALFDQKSMTNFGRPFCSFPFLFLASKWQKYAVHAFQKGKQVGRKRGLCQKSYSGIPSWPLCSQFSPAKHNLYLHKIALDSAQTNWRSPEGSSLEHKNQQKRVYPYPLGAGSARPNPKMGAPDPENPLFLGFAVLRRGLRPWSQTMVSEGARPWGRGRSGDWDCEKKKFRRVSFLRGTTLREALRGKSPLRGFSGAFAGASLGDAPERFKSRDVLQEF